MIDKVTTDKIINASNIIEVISDFVNLKKKGDNHVGNCPFNNCKPQTLMVSSENGIYKCFECGNKGNSLNFIMEHEQLSKEESLKWLAKKYNITIVNDNSDLQKELKNAKEGMLEINSFASETFINNLYNSDEGKAIGYKYFAERGIKEHTINKFELGYCRKNHDSFSKLAIEKGYNENFLVNTGLTIKRDDGSVFDRFSERVIFPIHNLLGQVIGFGGRTLRSDKKIAKYLNSPESEIYHKSRVLYGIYFAKKSIIKNDKCYLVEGYTDVMSMHQAGIENVVASSGTALTVEQIRLIRRFTPNITVLFDGDAAGIKAALRGIDLVLEEGLSVKVVLLPDGEDPDSYAQKHSATEFYDFIKENEADFISFKTKLLLKDIKGDPVKKSNLIQDIVRTISVIPDAITRALYVKECSGIMGVEEKILHAEINKILYRKKEQNWKRNQNPTGEPLNVKFPASNKFEPFEKEIIRLLITYGKKILFTVAQIDDKPEEEISAAQYIIREIEDEIEFITPVFKLIFDEYKKEYIQNNILPTSYFSNHENHLISKAAADLISDVHQLSKMWSKKGTYINTEEDNLKETIDIAINGYKYELVMNILQDIENQLKTNPPEEKQNDLFDKLVAYNHFKKEIAKALGDRIILRR